MDKEIDTTLIFDNGGGVTLRLDGKWAHWFDNMEQAANNYLLYMENGITNDWEGHEQDELDFGWSIDDIRNNSYRIYFHEDILKEIANEDSTGWENIDKYGIEHTRIAWRENDLDDRASIAHELFFFLV